MNGYVEATNSTLLLKDGETCGKVLAGELVCEVHAFDLDAPADWDACKCGKYFWVAVKNLMGA